jgi:hypothetical protein
MNVLDAYASKYGSTGASPSGSPNASGRLANRRMPGRCRPSRNCSSTTPSSSAAPSSPTTGWPRPPSSRVATRRCWPTGRPGCSAAARSAPWRQARASGAQRDRRACPGDRPAGTLSLLRRLGPSQRRPRQAAVRRADGGQVAARGRLPGLGGDRGMGGHHRPVATATTDSAALSRATRGLVRLGPRVRRQQLHSPSEQATVGSAQGADPSGHR